MFNMPFITLMETPMPTQDQVVLAKMLDEIIPENRAKGIPSGGILDVRNHVEAALKAQANDWAILLAEIRDFGANETNCPAFIPHLDAAAPALFQRLKRFAYIGYYGHAERRALFGPSAEATQPRGYDVPPESPEMLAELTASVTARGACFRALPDEDSQ